MKKIILFIFAAVFGFPILSPTALVETELSYKIRNERGVHSFGTYHNGAARVNLVNGNLMLKRPIFNRPGAAGFDLDLSFIITAKYGTGMRLKCMPDGHLEVWESDGVLDFLHSKQAHQHIQSIIRTDLQMSFNHMMTAHGALLIRLISFMTLRQKPPLTVMEAS